MKRKIAGILAAVVLIGTIGQNPTAVFAADPTAETEIKTENEKPEAQKETQTETVRQETEQSNEIEDSDRKDGNVSDGEENKEPRKETQQETQKAPQKETQKETQQETQKTIQKTTEKETEEEPEEETEEEPTENPTEKEEGPVHVDVTAEQIESLGVKKAIQNALNKAKKKATKTSPYIIKVAPGTYLFPKSYVIRMFSNTTLDMTGVTIKREWTSGTKRNTLRIGETREENEAAGETGYYYENIKVIGGVLDGQGVGCTMVKVAHTKNFTIENVTVKNAADAHLMEAAGVDGLTVRNCTFLNQTLSKDSLGRYEAIQLDILYSSHWSGHRSEALQTKNVMIDGCVFQNVPRGVGSHSAILNLPVDGITIKKCLFDNNKNAAIRSLNWSNCTITQNTVTNSPRGFLLYSVYDGGYGTFLPSVLAEEGGVSAPVSDVFTDNSRNRKYVITNNRISLQNTIDKSKDYSHSAITVIGDEITLSKKQSDGCGGLPKVNDYIQDVTVTGNVISAPSAFGIRLMDCATAVVSNNQLSLGQILGDADTYHGLAVTDESTGVSIQNNTVDSATGNGIYTLYSGVTQIHKNTVKNSGRYGISVYGSEIGSITENTVTDSGRYGIFMSGRSSVNELTNNRMNGNSGDGYVVASDSKLTKNSGNYISTDPKISSVQSAAKGLTIKWNKIDGADKYRIYRLVSGKHVRLATTEKTSYTDKKVTSGKKYTYVLRIIKNGKIASTYTVNPYTALFLSRPTLKTVYRYGSKALMVNWGKVSKCSGYQVSYSTSKKFKNARTKYAKKQKTVKKKVTKLTKKKTYYVRVRAYKGSGKNRVYSAWSVVKKVKL